MDVILLAPTHSNSDLVQCLRQNCPHAPIALVVNGVAPSSAARHDNIDGVLNTARLTLGDVLDWIETCIELADSRLIVQAGQQLSRIPIATPQAAMEALFDVIAVLVPYTGASIFTTEPTSVTQTYYRGYPPDYEAMLGTINFFDTYPLLAAMVTASGVLSIPDTHADPDWVDLPEGTWIRAWVGIPIRMNNQVISILNLDGDQPHQFTPRHIHRIAAVTDQVGMLLQTMQQEAVMRRTDSVLEAISRQNAFLFTSLSANNTIDDLCHTIAQTVVNVFGKTDCGVMLVNQRNGQVIRFARAGDYQVGATAALSIDGEGLVAEGIRKGQIVYAPDVRNVDHYLPSEPRTRSELVVPLRGRTGVIGVLDLQSTQLNAFSRWDQEGLVAFAEHAATAIQNLWMFTEERNHSQELEDRVREHTAQLNDAKERLEAILNRTHDAIVLLAPDGAVLQANRAFETLFELGQTEVFGLPLADLLDDSDQNALSAVLRRVQAEREPGSLEVIMRSQPENLFEAEITIAPVRFRGGEHTDMVCTIRDVSKHKAAEKSLQRMLDAERELSDLKTRFILTVAHEFRTPLTIISSSNELLRDYSDRMTDDKRVSHFEKIQQQIRQIESMLDDVALVQQAANDEITFQPATVYLEPFCRDLTNFINWHHGQPAVVFTTMGDDLSLNADSVLLQQALKNLLENAVIYAPKTDTVTFEVRAEADEVVFRIQDDGIGIPQKEQHLLFEPFYRANNATAMALPGTGLGLTITQFAIDRHQGTIDVQSQPDVGTTVTVRVPRKRA